MPEAYQLPETDESYIEEAKRLADRMLLRLTSSPDFEEGLKINEYFYLHRSNPETNDEIIIGYYPRSKATRNNQELSLVKVNPPEGFEFPAVCFTVLHSGLYHSAVGPVPKYVWSGNRKVYIVTNRFLLNESGQANREDNLGVISDSLGYVLDIPNAIRIEKPEESDLGAHINPLEPSDYEMIGYYLNQLDRV